MEIPENILRRIRELANKFGLEEEKLVKDYTDIFNSDFVQTDPQFRTTEDRHAYSIRVLWVRVAAQPPVKEFMIIPYGIREMRTTKSGVAQSKIYALIKTNGEFEKAPIICRGSLADIVDDVQVFAAYKTKLSAFKGAYFATNQTRFNDPKQITIDINKFLVNHLEATPIKIAETPYRPSVRDEKGYIDENDLRLIKGIVIRYNVGTRPDGTQYGVYTISDDSINKDAVTPDGKVIPSQFTVWAPSSMVKWDVESELMFLGTVSIKKDGEPFMNAIAVIPVHARLISE